jgi:hypothetical protein
MHTIAEEETRNRLILLMDEIDFSMAGKISRQALFQVFFLFFGTVGNDQNGTVDGEIPDDAEQGIKGLALMRDDKSSTREEVVQIVQAIGFENVRKAHGVNFHVGILFAS